MSHKRVHPEKYVMQSNILKGVAGYVNVTVSVGPARGGRTRTYKVRSFITDVRANYSTAVENAKLNAIYRYHDNSGKRDVFGMVDMSLVYDHADALRVKVLDVDGVEYEIDEGQTLKRENRDGHYFTVLRERDGSEVYSEPWRFKTVQRTIPKG